MDDLLLLHRRPDGSYVVLLNGMPYHALPGDPVFDAARVQDDGQELPPETVRFS